MLNRHATSARHKLLAGFPRRVKSPRHAHLPCKLFSTTSLCCYSGTTDPLPQLMGLTRVLVDRTALEPTKGWKHTRTLRGTEMRLTASLIKSTTGKRGPSIEKMSYNAGGLVGEDGEAEMNDGSISPGTFIETRRNEICAHGVVIGEVHVDRRWRYVTLTSLGEIWLPIREDILFSMPSLVPADLATRCGVTEVAEREINIHARVEVMKRLKQIEKLVDDAYTTVSRLGANVYDAVKHRDPQRWARTTVAEAASLMFPQANLTMIFATHKYLMNHPTHFVSHPHYHTLQAFNVRPQSHVDELAMIVKWSRLRDGPIQAFGDKARMIVKKNQKVHQQSRAGAPGQIPGDHSWTYKDKIILSFLLRSLRPYRSTQSDPYSIGQSAILKAIDPKGPPIDDEEVQKVLVKLGVVAPWQDLQVLSPDFDLDLQTERTSPWIHAENAVVTKGFSAPRKQGPLGPEDFYPSDPLDSVRHDFGDVPVFVIDEPGAEELDDGFSIERIPSEPDSFWVHVHIADPASVIPPTHVLAKEAATQMQTVYLLHRSWPLLPKCLVHSPQHGLSLGSRKNLPNNVLTISSKVNDQGHIMDFKVRAGVVRNINIITYDAVDCALNLPSPVQSYPFGGEPPKPLLSPILDAHVNDLRDLMSVRDRRIAKRYREGVYVPSFAMADIVDFQRVPTDIESPTFKPSVFEGFPNFGYSVAYTHETEVGARALVAEMMKLACCVVSRFCVERDIPALRRVAGPPLLTSGTDIQALLDMRTPNMYIPMEQFTRYLEYQPAGDYSLEPQGHFGLGVADGEGYVRATSPLRRYIDLVVHWQLHHALLGSAAPTRHFPFSADQVQEIAISARARDRMLKKTTDTHRRYWVTMFLKRWAEDTARGVERQDDPLKRLNCFTLTVPVHDTTTRKHQTEVLIPLLGTRAVLVGLDSADLPKGTSLDVDIHSFRLGIRPRLIVVQKSHV